MRARLAPVRRVLRVMPSPALRTPVRIARPPNAIRPSPLIRGNASPATLVRLGRTVRPPDRIVLSMTARVAMTTVVRRAPARLVRVRVSAAGIRRARPAPARLANAGSIRNPEIVVRRIPDRRGQDLLGPARPVNAGLIRNPVPSGRKDFRDRIVVRPAKETRVIVVRIPDRRARVRRVNAASIPNLAPSARKDFRGRIAAPPAKETRAIVVRIQVRRARVRRVNAALTVNAAPSIETVSPGRMIVRRAMRNHAIVVRRKPAMSPPNRLRRDASTRRPPIVRIAL
jgi:hypothetical protein